MSIIQLPRDGLLQLGRHILADGHHEQFNVLLSRQARLPCRRRQPVGGVAIDDEDADLFGALPPSVLLDEALTPHVFDDLGCLRRPEWFRVEHQQRFFLCVGAVQCEAGKRVAFSRYDSNPDHVLGNLQLGTDVADEAEYSAGLRR